MGSEAIDHEAFRKAGGRSARLDQVIRDRGLRLAGFRTDLPVQLIHFKGSLSAADLRALANAIDGEDDWKDAMLKDLKEDNSAYQRGLEDGKKQAMKAITDEPAGTMFVLAEDKALITLTKPTKRTR